jgi:endonuclease/exonuclease/phosphatase family metal-dependent hydrolase
VYVGRVEVRVMIWNLFHGRSVPPAGHDLFEQFAAALARWEWDVALLQEVPPWWPPLLASRLEASERHVLTSRNALPDLRRAAGVRWPDLVRANGGGCNTILVRDGFARIDEHRLRRLALLPERRWVHAVRLGSAWVANVHTQTSVRQASLAARTLLRWAEGAPAVLGGDFNLAWPWLDGLRWMGGFGVDHVFAAGGATAPSPPDFQVLEHGRLSDHAPVLTRIA